MKSNKSVLKIENLSVSYGHISAVREISIEVFEGELVSLLGANGAGKSTIISALLGVTRNQSGTVWFFGKDITGNPTDRIIASGISVVPEGRGVLPLMTVMENLRLGAYLKKGDISRNLESVFSRFPILAERKNQPAGTLSGGQQQMLAIGRALMSDPVLLIMDEPSLGLAPLAVSEVFNIMRDLKKDGLTILLSEQNARKALQCSDRAYVFEAGSLVFEGTADELMQDPRVQDAYLGNVL